MILKRNKKGMSVYVAKSCNPTFRYHARILNEDGGLLFDCWFDKGKLIEDYFIMNARLYDLFPERVSIAYNLKEIDGPKDFIEEIRENAD